jgi:hypothetical protein
MLDIIAHRLTFDPNDCERLAPFVPTIERNGATACVLYDRHLCQREQDSPDLPDVRMHVAEINRHLAAIGADLHLSIEVSDVARS